MNSETYLMNTIYYIPNRRHMQCIKEDLVSNLRYIQDKKVNYYLKHNIYAYFLYDNDTKQVKDNLSALTSSNISYNILYIHLFDFDQLSQIDQSAFSTYFNRSNIIFIIYVNRYSMLVKKYYSLCVLKKDTTKTICKISDISNEKGILSPLNNIIKKYINTVNNKDLKKLKKLAILIYQSINEYKEFFTLLMNYIVENKVITNNHKYECIKLISNYEHYYLKSKKKIIIIEYILFNIAELLKHYCL